MKRLLYIFLVMIVFVSCRMGKKQAYEKLETDLRNKLIVTVVPPKAGLNNFLIQDSKSRRVLGNVRELARNWPLVMPPGDYTISAEGYNDTTLSLDSDCIIRVQGRGFLASLFSQVTFSDGTNFFGKNIIEGQGYILSILELDKQQPQAYSAEITGKGKINLAQKEVDGRIVSASRLVFQEGKITVSVTLNGDPSKIEPKEFFVLDNDTQAPVLDKIGKYFYRSTGTTQPLSFLMSDASGIDVTKTYLEINGNKYYPETAVRERGNSYRVSIAVPQLVFEEKHSPVNMVLHMTDNDTTHGPSDQASRDETIVINEQTGFAKAFNLTWNGNPLEYARVHVYSDASGVSPQMTMREYNALNFGSFIYNGLFDTLKNGAITVENLRDNDTITFFVMKTGQDAKDMVYAKTFRVNGDTPVPVEVDMPAKGEIRKVLQITDGAVDEWVGLRESLASFDAFFYYMEGVEDDTISPETVERGSKGFKKLPAESYRIGDNKIELTAYLDDISTQTHFNYWCLVSFENGVSFAMMSTATEKTPVPVLYRRQQRAP